MLHINRMVFGAGDGEGAVDRDEHFSGEKEHRLPFSCRLTLLLAAVPVLVLGFYIPKAAPRSADAGRCRFEMNPTHRIERAN